MDIQDNVQLEQSNEILNLFEKLQIFDDNMIVDSVKELSFPRNGELRNNEICFYKIKQLPLTKSIQEEKLLKMFYYQ